MKLELQTLIVLLPGLVALTAFGLVRDGEQKERGTAMTALGSATLVLLSSMVTEWICTLTWGPLSGATSPPTLSEYATGAGLLRLGVAGIIGVGLAALVNRDVHLWIAAKMGIMAASGSGSAWFLAFRHHRKHWVRLYFKDGRILVGYPKFVSGVTEHQQLFVVNAEWSNSPVFHPRGRTDEAARVEHADGIVHAVLVVNLSEVIAIDFIPVDQEGGWLYG